MHTSQTAGDTVHVVNILDTRNARDKWEKVFKKVFIQPVLEVLLQPLEVSLHVWMCKIILCSFALIPLASYPVPSHSERKALVSTVCARA